MGKIGSNKKMETGMQCEFCKQVAPESHIGEVNFRFESRNEDHQKIVATMPERIKNYLRDGDVIGVWAHLRGYGCGRDNE